MSNLRSSTTSDPLPLLPPFELSSKSISAPLPQNLQSNLLLTISPTRKPGKRRYKSLDKIEFHWLSPCPPLAKKTTLTKVDKPSNNEIIFVDLSPVPAPTVKQKDEPSDDDIVISSPFSDDDIVVSSPFSDDIVVSSPVPLPNVKQKDEPSDNDFIFVTSSPIAVKPKLTGSGLIHSPVVKAESVVIDLVTPTTPEKPQRRAIKQENTTTKVESVMIDLVTPTMSEKPQQRAIKRENTTTKAEPADAIDLCTPD